MLGIVTARASDLWRRIDRLEADLKYERFRREDAEKRNQQYADALFARWQEHGQAGLSEEELGLVRCDIRYVPIWGR